jgi:DNA modification methylase
MSKIQKGREKQLLEDDVVHDWYRFVLAFPDHLVEKLCERFGITEDDVILDPFCGTGTTLVEAKQLGIDSVGIESNPACVLASRVKTEWDLNPAALRQAADDIIERLEPEFQKRLEPSTPLFSQGEENGIELESIKKNLRQELEEIDYFIDTGMLDRGWMNEIPLLKSGELLSEIKSADVSDKIRDVLLLALCANLVEDNSNVSFGPELYVSKKKKKEKKNVKVLSNFDDKISKIVRDLKKVKGLSKTGDTKVLEGDSRNCGEVLLEGGVDSVDYVITSPPYPTEKDYSRQTRLELVFLGHVFGRSSLQSVKKEMIRSHSKGIYVDDNDGKYVEDVEEVQEKVAELEEKAAEKNYGFAKMYPRIIDEYFGGMHRHLDSLRKVLSKGGVCAYVVGDQRTYLQTYTPTGKILGIVAERLGYEHEESITWRTRVGTTGSGKEIDEEIVILRYKGD